jgi:preprotein translocase subunit SecA
MIIDEFTGRALPGRRWSDGLHQAVEAKEKVRIEAESETLATISFQNFFRLYDKLAGMTGTAETEAAEFHKTYKMEVVVIPTNMSAIRIDHNDVVYRTEKEKFGAVLEDIAERHQSGQPILVGTISIEKSEILHKMLSRLKIPHNVLNAKHHAREAEIIAQAGREAAVTIATNMAGRGTDIILGGNPEPFIAEIISSKDGNPKSIEASIFIREMLKGNEREARQIAPEVADISDQEYTQINEMREKWVIEAQRVKEAGGLHIIGTERHDSRRIDNQLRGRSGRQGDPGSSRFYLSLEDDLMRRFGSEKLGVFMERIGMEHGEPIEHRFVTKAIENAQAKVEAHNFEIRKHMLEYDDVMNIQRKTIYGLRREILNVKEIEEKFFDMFEELLHVFIDRYCPPKTPVEDWDIDALENMLRKVFNLRTQIDDDKMLDSNNPIDTVFDLIWENVEEQYQMRKDALPSGLINQIMAEIYLYEIDENWKAHLTAIDHLREGVGLQGYRPIDPKLVYKREAFDMFQQLLITIHSKAVEKLFNLNIIIPEKHEPTADTMIIKPRRPRKIEMHHGSIDAEDAPLPEPTGPTTVRRERSKIGRNEPCWCGSGKKYKKCCAGKDQSENAAL